MNKIANAKTIIVAGVMTFLFVWLIRMVFINHYGVDLPWWDQWDGEINALYLPYLNGTLSLKAFFVPHNEHRILFTRIFNLIIFILYKGYSPVLAMKLQAGIMALIASLFTVWNIIDCKKVNYYSISSVVLLFGFPIGYANLLSSFQSQFYFMILFSIVTIRLVAVDAISFGRFFWIMLFSIFSFFTVASGFFAPLVAAVVLLYLAMKEKQRGTRYLLMSMSLVIVAIIMVMLTPLTPSYEGGVGAKFFKVFINVVVWPYGLGAIWWGVFLIFILKKIRIKKEDLTKYLFPLALYIWLSFQFIAITYARGTLNDRYFDIPIIGIVAMIFLLDEWGAKEKIANFIKMFIIVFVLAFTYYKSVHKMEHDQQKRLHGVSTLKETMQLMRHNNFFFRL